VGGPWWKRPTSLLEEKNGWLSKYHNWEQGYTRVNHKESAKEVLAAR